MNVEEEKELDIPNCKTSTCKGTEIGYKVAGTRTIKSLEMNVAELQKIKEETQIMKSFPYKKNCTK